MIENVGLVSVLMAVYNTRFALVKRALDSIFNQTYSNIEIIVMDDGSDNECLHKLVDYAKLYEHKITFLQQENVGQSISINRAVAKSKGRYITIIDADDEYEKNHIELCLKEMRKYDLIASTTKTIVSSEKDYYVTDKHDASKLIHVDDCILFATLFGKRAVFTTLKFENKYAADANFYELAKEHFLVTKVKLRSYIYYRNNPNSITARMKEKMQDVRN